MPNFKYTVVNKEGKQLNGTIQAPNENAARTEMNSLGFSILEIKEIVEEEKKTAESETPKFIFEAIDKNSKLITGTIPAKTKEDAYTRLKTEYQLTVTSIYNENATQQEIETARKEGTQQLENELKSLTLQQQTQEQEKQIKSQEEIQKEGFQKNKVENIIQEVLALLKKFDTEFDKAQKNEINKKIDKLLRIKHSTNIEYILASAEDLLNYIKAQDAILKEKQLTEKRFELKMETSALLGELKQTQKPKNLSEDLVNRISKWKESQERKPETKKGASRYILKVLLPIQRFFTTPPEIKALQNEVTTLNKQLIDLLKLYIKEPGAEYKAKVKNSIKTVWQKRKTTKSKIKELKQLTRQGETKTSEKDEFAISIFAEIVSLSGWIIAIFMAYYFLTLYLQTKDFGLNQIPEGFRVYDSYIFKYLFAILFLLHATLAIKINFFKNSKITSIILTLIFFTGTTVIMLNF